MDSVDISIRNTLGATKVGQGTQPVKGTEGQISGAAGWSSASRYYLKIIVAAATRETPAPFRRAPPHILHSRVFTLQLPFLIVTLNHSFLQLPSSVALKMAAPQLPDFGAMGQHFNALGDQLQRFANVPAMQEGQLLQNIFQQNNDILQQLVALNHRVDGLNGRVDGLNGRMDELSNKFDQLENRVIAEYMKTPHPAKKWLTQCIRHHNSLSRIANNRLPTPEHLEDLHNVRSNELIPNLPNTVQGIQGLSSMYFSSFI